MMTWDDIGVGDLFSYQRGVFVVSTVRPLMQLVYTMNDGRSGVSTQQTEDLLDDVGEPPNDWKLLSRRHT